MPSTYSPRRLVLVSVVLFVLILAFLAGRVHAGADPAQDVAPAAVSTPAPAIESTPYGGSAPPGYAPDQGAVPGQDGIVPGQDADPPATFAS